MFANSCSILPASAIFENQLFLEILTNWYYMFFHVPQKLIFANSWEIEREIAVGELYKQVYF